MPVIKFCGITNALDALCAIEAGADLLGFNFYPPSPRSISPGECRRLIEAIRPALVRPRGKVQTVGVFVNAPVNKIKTVLDHCALDLAQLSGDEPSADLESLGERGFKALRQPGKGGSLLQASAAYPQRTGLPAFLVDAGVAGQYGGTGHVADWAEAQALARRCPILLAGGLKPENVTAALRAVRPWGVDVASGIESSPGRKDPQKMRAFVRAVREVELEEEGR